MRHTFRHNPVIALVLFGVLCVVASAQSPNKVNPFTGIAWPANCNASGTVAYNFLTNTCFAAGTSTAPIVYKGTWSGSTSYVKTSSEVDAVFYAGSQWITLVNANLNHQPDVSPSQWALLISGGPGGITQLTGDVTTPASSSGSTVATLATVNGSPGTCGDATHVCQIITNGKGLVPTQTPVAITASGSTSNPVTCTANSPGILCAALAPYYVSGSGALATTTSGTTAPGTAVTLASSGCTTAGFDAGTAGTQYGHQNVSIAGAGAAGALYLGTVTTCVGTAMVLGSATSSSVGAGAAVQHDEYTPINAMFAATAHSRNDIYLPCGTVNVNGPLQDTGGANAVLIVPTIVSYSEAPTMIGMHGCAPFDSAATYQTTNATVVQTAVNSGNLIGGYDVTASTYAPFTNVWLTLDNLNFLLPANPGIVAVNSRYILQLQANHDWCGAAGSTFPTTTTGGCFFYPSLSDTPAELGLDLVATGVYTGFIFGEHAQIRHAQASGDVNGFEFDTGTNSTIPSNESNSISVDYAWCGSSTNCVATGAIGATISIQNLDVESTTNAVNDASNLLHGKIDYKINPIAGSSIVGATGLTLFNLLNGACAGPGCPSSGGVSLPYSGLAENWISQQGQGGTFANNGFDLANFMTGTSVTWSTSTGFTGKVATYNGTSSVSVAATDTNTNFDGTLPFSVCAWFNITSLSGGDNWVVEDIDPSSPFSGWGMEVFGSVTPSGALNVYVANTISSNMIQIHSPGATVTAGALDFACFTYDGTKTAAGTIIYNNGAAQTPTVVANTLTGTVASGTPVSIGALPAFSGFFPGTIGRVKVWNRQLTATEISTMFTAGVSAF